MAAKYSKAPISELVLGAFFNPGLLLNNGVLFELINKLLVEFPVLNTHPVFAFEELANGVTIQSQADYTKTGFSTYHLISEDGKWQILLLQDMITLHWNRKDDESVGNYPGFTTTFRKFKNIYDTISELLKKHDLDMAASIKSYYLCYNDRVDLEEYKSKGLNVDNIINISTPSFEYASKVYVANNYWNRYSVTCDAISGYSLITINTPTLETGKQLLIVENKLRGKTPNSDIEEWFLIAHDSQMSFFEKIFKQEILKSWE